MTLHKITSFDIYLSIKICKKKLPARGGSTGKSNLKDMPGSSIYDTFFLYDGGESSAGGARQGLEEDLEKSEDKLLQASQKLDKASTSADDSGNTSEPK
jgi:hypothetical protein